MELLDRIIDFLGEQTGFRQNWQIVWGILAGIAAALAAREFARKWRELKSYHHRTLVEGPLNAIVVSDEEHGTVTYTAQISSVDGGFRVTVTQGDESGPRKPVDQVLLSLDEVEQFLRANTKFVLSDFR